jgi:UPF0755 protein
MRGFRLFLLGLLLLALAVGGFAAWRIFRPLNEVEFTIKPGSSLRSVASQMEAQGTGAPSRLVVWYATWTGRASRLKAGTYAVKPGDALDVVLDRMVRGEQSLKPFALIEGTSWRGLRAVLADEAALKAESKTLSESELKKALGLDAYPSIEGLLFPDTYSFARNSSDLALLKTAADAMQKRLAAAWELRAPSSVLKTPYEALILASIIEKESGKAEDRTTISSVFHNRLRIGMRLQTDPTVIYGMGESYDGNIRKKDLQTDTPYNTYTRAGLPPTPIAFPSAAALQAAVQPANTRYIYFVARGDGSSEFSETLDAHNRAVDRFIRGKK